MRSLHRYRRFTDVLLAESRAVSIAAETLDQIEVDRALEIILNCNGKVIVCGIGKSGIVARKIAVTLASTGTLSTFLHPCDALHGDIGNACTGDVAILVSHSGESDEIVSLIPHLKHRGIKLICLGGRPGTTISRMSDVSLYTTVEREACPLNLAPTASTAVAFAIGDAIAISLMDARCFSSSDFVRNHPSGRLGKRLTVRVADIMNSGSRNPVLMEAASLVDLVEVLCRNGLGAVNIVNGQGQLVGLVTDGDIRRSVNVFVDDGLRALTAASIMKRLPVTTFPNEMAFEALRKMEERSAQISVLPVVDPQTNTCLGLLRLHDIIQSGII